MDWLHTLLNQDLVPLLASVGVFTLGYLSFRLLAFIYDILTDLAAERMAEKFHKFNLENYTYIGQKVLINGAEYRVEGWERERFKHEKGGTYELRQLYLTTTLEDELGTQTKRYVRILSSSKPIPKV